MARIYISKDKTGQIVITFAYDPLLVTKIKTIPGHGWNPAEKLWSFSNTHGTLEKILEVFEGKEIHIDLALQCFAGDCPRFTDRAKRSRRIGTVPVSKK
jgi:hypothetical protein